MDLPLVDDECKNGTCGHVHQVEVSNKPPQPKVTVKPTSPSVPSASVSNSSLNLHLLQFFLNQCLNHSRNLLCIFFFGSVVPQVGQNSFFFGTPLESQLGQLLNFLVNLEF